MPEIIRLARNAVGKVWPRVTARTEQGWQWVRRNPRTALWVAGVTAAVVLLILLITHWNPYKKQWEAFAPLFTLGAGLAIAAVTLMRHFAQTEADRQRRITESFSKAIEQLGSDKLEVRLGGIYTLERISRESPPDHWTVMENLTAFVREHTQRTEGGRTGPPDHRIAEYAYSLWDFAGRPEGRSEEFWTLAVGMADRHQSPAADVAAVLTVIQRRSDAHYALEARGIDFSHVVLRGANLVETHLERANLNWAHLENAHLSWAHLENAYLSWTHLERADFVEAHLKDATLDAAHLEGADFIRAHLEGASLSSTHLEGVYFIEAHLEGARLYGAHLEGASLDGAHLEGADLSNAKGLTQAQIDKAFGDAATELPEGLTRPAHWGRPAVENPRRTERHAPDLP